MKYLRSLYRKIDAEKVINSAVFGFVCGLVFFMLFMACFVYRASVRQDVVDGFEIFDDPLLETSVKYNGNRVWHKYDNIKKVTPKLIEYRLHQADSVFSELEKIREIKLY